MSDLSFTSFDIPGGSASVTPVSISGSVIVGNYQNSQDQTFAFEDDAGVVNSLIYPNSLATTAGGANASGDIVGTYTDASNVTHEFEYNGQTFTSMDFPGTTQLSVTGISDSGVIVGSYTSQADGNYYGFIDNSGVITQLDYGTVGGLTQSGITSAFINDSGEIAGSYLTGSDGSDSSFGYVLSNGIYTTIPLTGATGVNVVGISPTGAVYGSYGVDRYGDYQGFVYQTGCCQQYIWTTPS